MLQLLKGEEADLFAAVYIFINLNSHYENCQRTGQNKPMKENDPQVKLIIKQWITKVTKTQETELNKSNYS